MNSTRELVQKVQQFGVPEPEGRLYYHLCRLGRSTAAEVARAAGISRTDGYRLLSQMQERGLVEKTLERPARFVPVPVREVLDRFLTDRRRSLDELTTLQDALASAWPHGEELQTPDRRISTHRGRSQVQGLVERIIDGTEEDLILSTNLRALATLNLQRILERLKGRRDAGVPVRVLTCIEVPDIPIINQLSKVAMIRHLALGEYHEMLIADTNSIALFVGGSHGRDPDGGHETLLHLTAPPFVMAQKALVDQEWSRGIDLAERIRELRTGSFPERAELLRGRWIRTERMKQMLFRNDRVTILAPAHELRRWESNGVARVLRRRQAEGCVMIVLSNTQPAPGTSAGRGYELRRIAGTRRLLVLGGTRELLTVEECPDKAGSTNEAEWSTWTTIRSAIDEARDRLDAALARAKF